MIAVGSVVTMPGEGLTVPAKRKRSVQQCRARLQRGVSTSVNAHRKVPARPHSRNPIVCSCRLIQHERFRLVFAGGLLSITAGDLRLPAERNSSCTVLQSSVGRAPCTRGVAEWQTWYANIANRYSGNYFRI